MTVVRQGLRAALPNESYFFLCSPFRKNGHSLRSRFTPVLEADPGADVEGADRIFFFFPVCVRGTRAANRRLSGAESQDGVAANEANARVTMRREK